MSCWFEHIKRECPECGKKFEICGEDWGYTLNNKGKKYYYCSWSCLRAAEKRKPQTKIQQRERILQAIEDGLSVREISELLDVSPQVVSYWKKRMTSQSV